MRFNILSRNRLTWKRNVEVCAMVSDSKSPAENLSAPPCEVAKLPMWRKALDLDRRIDARFRAGLPRTHVIVGWILRFLYGFVSNPIAAIIISLVLVPFVIAGSIPLVVWGSITLAWILCVIWATRSETLKQLSSVSRFVFVVIIAIVSYKASRRYIRWSLVNYYAHAEPKVAPSENRLDNKNVQSLNPDDFYGRIEELIKKEMRPYMSAIAPHPPKPNPLESLDNTSLVAVAKVTAKEIDDLMAAWRYQIKEEIEPRRRDQVYERDPAPEEDERNRLDAFFDNQVEEANQ